MTYFPFLSPLTSFLLGAAVAVSVGTAYQSDTLWHLFDAHNHNHSEETHYHADVVVAVNGEPIDLSDDQYMSGIGQILAEHVHLHDNNDDVIHYHDTGITLASFLTSIGLDLNEQCLTYNEQDYCTDDENVLRLYVNGTLIDNPTRYVAADEDQLLLYHGPDNQERINTLLQTITTDACIYSLTCPERGTPPPESCGLTCEI